jgi:hypothetical protein
VLKRPLLGRDTLLELAHLVPLIFVYIILVPRKNTSERMRRSQKSPDLRDEVLLRKPRDVNTNFIATGGRSSSPWAAYEICGLCHSARSGLNPRDRIDDPAPEQLAWSVTVHDRSSAQMRPDEQTESVGSFRAERLISPPPLRAAASMIGARCTDVNASGMTTRPPPWLATEGDDGRFDFYVANGNARLPS